jgi:hypothetical protein
MKKVIGLLILFLTINLYSQSPWTKKKGAFYTQLSFSTISNYNTLFGSPDKKINGNVSDNTIQFYSEYGLTNKTTLIANIPLKLISHKDISIICVNAPCSNLENNKTSLGNIELGIKHNFYNKKWLVSGQLNIEANTSVFDANSGIRTGYDAWTVTPLLTVGRGYSNWYLQGFTGVNVRTNNYSSNFKFGGEIGYKPLQKLWVIANLDITKSFNNGDVLLPTSNLSTGLYINNQEYVAFGMKAIGEITKNFGLTAGVGGAFSGNNVAKQGALNFGVYHKF